MTDQPPAGPTPADAAQPAPTNDVEPRFPELTFASAARYPVTTALALASIAVSLLGWNEPLLTDLLITDSRAWAGQLWRLVTSALPHGDVLHLAFNLYWLWVFGTRVEAAFGRRATAGICLLLEVGSSCAQHALAEPGIGLSGIVYGLFGLAWALSRRDPSFRRVADGQTVMLFVVWFFACIALTEAGVWNVGNVAHAAGAGLGLLLGLALAAPGRRAAWGLVAVVTLAFLVGSAAKPASPRELADLAYRDLVAGRDAQAAERLKRAVAREPGEAHHWINLAVARQRLGQWQPAVEAYERAAGLRPSDKDLSRDLLAAKAVWAHEKHTAGDLDGAIRIYLEVLAADDRNAHCWYNLGVAYASLSQAEAARVAFRRAVAIEPSNQLFRTALSRSQ